MQDKNVRPDFAKLPEDSEFYQPEDKRTTREKLKTMNRKEKAEFIVEYYGINIVVAVVLISVSIGLVVHFACKKENVLSVYVVNTTQDDCPGDDSAFYADFLKRNGVNPDKVDISISANLSVPVDAQDSASQTNIQMIQTQLMANSVDVFFAPEDFFKSLGEFEYLADLNDYLPADVLKKYKDDLVYIKGLDSGKTYPVGIRLKNNKWIKKTGWYKDEVVVGIADNAKDGDLATALVLEILGENK